jgi:pimeloyl-ACP methyl ester carboxylesterase
MPPMTMSPVAYAETWESIRDHFERGTLVAGLAEFDGPTLFVHGRESPIPPERSEESAALVPGAHFEVLADCGHFPWLEQPGAVAQAVERLLTERTA